MTGPVHAPPGRAGRLWLQHRLATAERGAALLDHKLRILRTERERFALLERRTAAGWEAADRAAAEWLLRAVILGGERSLRLAASSTPAQVQVQWNQPMGVRYPAEATCALPDVSPEAPPAGSAALVEARERHRRALEAAVEHAAVQAAVRVLAAEERATRRRLRAIEERWVPRLREALQATQLKLDEDEHADGVRLRWAAGRLHGPGQEQSRGEQS
ncbi:MAG: V-type ATP synthase subunit D [Nocardioides sp.]